VEYGKLLYAFLNRNAHSRLPGLGFNRRWTSVKERFENVMSFECDQQKHARWQGLVPLCVALTIVPLSVREMNFDVAVESRPPLIVMIVFD
jgi:hypothetical protein